MNPELAAALEQLRDIHLPSEPGWWPPAPGWWIAGAMALGLTGFLLYGAYRWYLSRRPFRQFKTELLAMPLQPGMAARDLQTISALVRRLIITLYGREQVASLTGESWLKLLDTLSGSTDFTNGPGRVLEYGPYQAAAPDQLQPLRRCLIGLCRPHRLPSLAAAS